MLEIIVLLAFSVAIGIVGYKIQKSKGGRIPLEVERGYPKFPKSRICKTNFNTPIEIDGVLTKFKCEMLKTYDEVYGGRQICHKEIKFKTKEELIEFWEFFESHNEEKQKEIDSIKNKGNEPLTANESMKLFNHMKEGNCVCSSEIYVGINLKKAIGEMGDNLASEDFFGQGESLKERLEESIREDVSLLIFDEDQRTVYF
jgi:hypothetical protein